MKLRPEEITSILKSRIEDYDAQTDLSCLCLRFGWVVDRNSPDLKGGHRYLNIASTYEDITRLIAAAIDAPPSVKYGIFHGISNNRHKRLDISETRRVLDYQPQDCGFELAERGD